jgi:Flp pilus assembly CpaE family ATPase
MKIWNSYGSEHSANLVMIGTFKDVPSAKRAKEIIDKIAEFMMDSDDDHEDSDRYSDAALALLSSLHTASLRPAELAQFRYDISSEQKGDKIVITTDEYDVSGFLKILIDEGARVEVYSAHLHPNTGLGR